MVALTFSGKNDLQNISIAIYLFSSHFSLRPTSVSLNIFFFHLLYIMKAPKAPPLSSHLLTMSWDALGYAPPSGVGWEKRNQNSFEGAMIYRGDQTFLRDHDLKIFLLQLIQWRSFLSYFPLEPRGCLGLGSAPLVTILITALISLDLIDFNTYLCPTGLFHGH